MSDCFPDLYRLCGEMESLCRRIAARDLDNRTLYVVPVSSLDGALRHLSCGGFTCPWLYEHLARRKDFQGPGPAVVINDLNVAAMWRSHIAKLGEGNAPGVGEAAIVCEGHFLDLTIHELAHVTERNVIDAPLAEMSLGNTTPADAHLIRRSFRRRRQQKRTGPGIPWAGHDERFIRAACHLWFRTRHFGKPATLWACGAGPAYGLSPPGRYAETLIDELFSMQLASIREILATPPPAKFIELFAMDTLVRYPKRNKPRRKRVASPAQALLAAPTPSEEESHV